MRAWVFSDLHLEMGASANLEVPKADICICAGDIADGGVVASVRFLGELVAPFMPVVFVPGNHEYYRASFIEGIRAGVEEARKYDGVFLLDREAISINDVHIIGATLWTDFALFGNPRLAMLAADGALNDYRKIKLSKQPYRRFTTHFAMAEHFKARECIDTCLSASIDFPTIVVTHHAPSILSVSREYIDDPLTPSFASNLERMVLRHQPRLWVHGHLHNSSDYRIGSTRVICNPRGLPGESSSKTFNPKLVVEVHPEFDEDLNKGRGQSLGSVLDDQQFKPLSRRLIVRRTPKRPD
ncbi:hypothetical protein GR217_22870 [Rhizobium leguminosarum]|uniref:Calcineurin-like phosphoesterase domain-containing protein n=1 Tax=Rhizobium ruizarguesonis TaxID=2081791 RepID=A0AAE5C4K5_9HYPH|nr:metallophosphoesterase [Rhizobium ruizarguesonis]NEI50531.1 hypothetical protein [Rhizobium ruizarguesonis]